MPSLNVCKKILDEHGIKYTVHEFNSKLLNIIDPIVRNRIEQVKQIAESLSCEIGVVGGFVRDLLLKKPSKDVDFVVIKGDLEKLTETVAKELKAKKARIYNQTLTTQIRFSDGILFEFNAPRIEKYDQLSRVPIVRRGTIIDDLIRRDFTINSLILFGNKYIDIFNGTKDLNEGIIRTTREPSTVFSEDYLRIFRAIRFACLLDFEIEENTVNGILKNVYQLRLVAKERIIEEIKLTAKEYVVCCFTLMKELKVIDSLFPELKNKQLCNKYLVSLTFEKIQKELEYIKEQKDIDQFLCLFALIMREQYHEKENYLLEIKKQLKNFKLSKKEIEKILLIVKYSTTLLYHIFYPTSKKELRLLLREVFEIKEEMIAMNMAENNLLKEKNRHLEKIVRELRELSKNKELIFVKPAVNGYDLMKLGLKGTEIKECKEFLIHALMDESLKNTKDECLNYVKKYYLRL